MEGLGTSMPKVLTSDSVPTSTIFYYYSAAQGSRKPPLDIAYITSRILGEIYMYMYMYMYITCATRCVILYIHVCKRNIHTLHPLTCIAVVSEHKAIAVATRTSSVKETKKSWRVIMN